MADKLDFMTELAKDVNAKKHGQTGTFGTINDFVPKQRTIKETDYDRDQDYENTQSVSMRQKPAPAAPVRQEEPVYEETYQEDPQQGYEQPAEEEYTGEYEEVPHEEATTENMYGAGGDNGPASFNEEVRVKVDKPKFQIPTGAIIGIVAAVALIGFLIWFFGMRAKIVMPDFTGKTIKDVGTWAQQNKIENTAIARNYEYSLEYETDVVISQTPAAGTRVKTNTPITLTVSQGADPNEHVDFPDIKNMTLDELNEWKNTNKLTKTKISTEFSTTTEKDAVISYELKNVSENDFTRGSTLTVRVSKGPAPAGQVTVENFVGKNYSEVVTWANNKKLKLARQEMNSDTVESGFVISQLPASGQALAEGDTLTVTVSKGKGVKVPNLVGYSKEQLEAWSSSKNNSGITIVKQSKYNEAPLGSVIAQSVSPGQILDNGDVLSLTISLYMPIFETNSRAWYGKDYLELRAWCDDVNYNGADIQAGSWGDWKNPTCSDTYPTPGQVVNYACYYGTSDLADGCGRPLNNNSRINYQISSGPCTVVTPTPEPTVAPTPEPTAIPVKDIVFTSDNIKDLSAISSFCNSNSLSCTFNEPVTEGPAVSVTVDGGTPYTTGGSPFSVVIKSNSKLVITYNKAIGPSPSAPAESGNNG